MTSQCCCALQFHRDDSQTILRGGILAWAVSPACWWLTGMKDKIEKYAASDSPCYLQTVSVSLQSQPWSSQPCLLSHLCVCLHPSKRCTAMPSLAKALSFSFLGSSSRKRLHPVPSWGGKERQAPLIVSLTPQKVTRRPSLPWSSGLRALLNSRGTETHAYPKVSYSASHLCQQFLPVLSAAEKTCLGFLIFIPYAAHSAAFCCKLSRSFPSQWKLPAEPCSATSLLPFFLCRALVSLCSSCFFSPAQSM